MEEKRETLVRLLNTGMAAIALVTSRPGVDIPDSQRVSPVLVLNLSWKFGSPMEINGWGIRATLSFDGVPYPCAVPWGAVYAMALAGGNATRQSFWHEDGPTEEEQANQPKGKSKGGLRSIN